jgi:hypothetical protein
VNILQKLASSLLFGLLSTSLVFADDIDIYTTLPPGSPNLAATVVVIDLNAVGLCDNVLTNPSSQPQCGVLQLNTTLGTLLGTGNVSNLPTSTICSLYGALATAGLTPVLQIPAVIVLGVVVTPAIPITTTVCNTLSSLGLGSLLSTITATVSGIFNPLLSTTLSNLSTAITSVLAAALSAASLVLADPSSLANLNTLLTGILTPLINSNVSFVVSHANRSNSTNPATYYTSGGKSYACAFNDITGSASLNPPLRETTTNCSNGGYFVLGFFNVSNVQSTVTKVLGLLTGGLLSGSTLSATGIQNLLKSLTTLPLPLTPPFQEVENYDEIVHYLKDAVVYNGPLASYDGAIFSLVARDKTIETAPGSLSTDQYTGGASTISSCSTVNVINLQVTADTLENDSDTDVRSAFPSVGLNSDGTVNFASLVQTAQNTGFAGKNGQTVKMNSYFIIQDNLTPNIGALQNVGANVLTYTSALGLFGAGQTLSLAQNLVTNATLVTASNTADEVSSTGTLPPTFFALFKPASGKSPNWQGNVKRLNLSTSSSGISQYIDAKGIAAIASDGGISTTALTIWTNPSLLGTNVSADGRETTLGGAGQKIPGYMFGGGGNPGFKNADNLRQLFYESIPTSGAPVLKSLDADATQTSFASERTELAPYLNCPTTSGDTTCQQLLLYARGFNVGSSSAPVSNLTTAVGRSWLDGAVLHSRPVAVNYGARSGYSQTSPDIRVLYGSTDGFLHSVRNSTSSGNDGSERWAFMPREAMADLTALRNSSTGTPFPYGVDGTPAVLIIDRSPASSTYPTGGPADDVLDSSNPYDHVYAFVGLRRGGSAYNSSGSNYYGIDITNPDVPKLMWRLGRDGVYSANSAAAGTYTGDGSVPGLISGSSSQFTGLAQTFSTPAIGQMSFTNSSGTVVTRAVLLFGGGYNGGVGSTGIKVGKDLNNSTNTVTAAQVGVDDTLGNSLYIVDAVTGELVWKAARTTAATASVSTSGSGAAPVFLHPLLADSIASDVTALDTDGDGLIDRLYVGDTGGRVWRADFAGTDRTKWTLGPIASLGRGHPSSGGAADTTNVNDRRFFNAPDYVPSQSPSTGPYDVVLIGSGDREDPFNTSTINWLYAIRDGSTISGKTLSGTGSNTIITSASDPRLVTQSSLTDLTTACSQSSTSTCASANALVSGWRLQLTGVGEKATSVPVTIANTVLFTTYIPPTNAACGIPAQGSGNLYGVNLLDSRPYLPASLSASSSSRSTALPASGIPGEVTAQTATTLGVSTSTFSITTRQNYPVYWRERRGDDEPPSQSLIPSTR